MKLIHNFLADETGESIAEFAVFTIVMLISTFSFGLMLIGLSYISNMVL